MSNKMEKMESVRRSKRTPKLKKDQKSTVHSIKPVSESANVQNPVLDTVKKTVRQPKQKPKASQNVSSRSMYYSSPQFYEFHL